MATIPFSRPQRGVVALRLAVLVGLLVTMFAVPRFTASAKSSQSSPPWTIGVSNNLIGNGWRDEMVCSIRAQVHHSGKGHTNVQQNQLNTNLQISQIRTMISQGVNAIVIDPNSPTALNGAINQAVSRGITIVIVDQFIPSLLNKPGIYQAANDQRAYGRLGMQWLVNRLHGHGNIVELQGIAGAPANTDRENGQQDVLKNYPNIHVVAKEYTNWVSTKGEQEMTALLNSGKKIDGVWTSGIDYAVVNAYLAAHRPLVPIVGADNNGFVHQLLTVRGLVGAAITNPPPIGGVGASIALRVLAGGHPPLVTTLKPQVWANNNAFGLRQLRSHYLATQGPFYAADWIVKPYSNYTRAELFTCSSSW
jgi:ribose transport system substrate-binding protein